MNSAKTAMELQFSKHVNPLLWLREISETLCLGLSAPLYFNHRYLSLTLINAFVYSYKQKYFI